MKKEKSLSSIKHLNDSEYIERRNFLFGLFFWLLAFLTTFPFKKENGILGLQRAHSVPVTNTDGLTVSQHLEEINKQLADIAINVKAKGATGDGATNDTVIIQSVINAASDNAFIMFPQGYTFLIDSLNVTGKKLTFIGYGSTIKCNSSQGVFYKTDHDKKLTIIGLRFIGTGKAIKWITTPSGTQYDEFSFQDCRFENADYGIYLDGVREGIIINCSFEGITQKGIYRARSINHNVIGCFWKNTVYGINDNGDGTQHSAGLRVVGGTMIGCQYGVRTSMVDYSSVTDVMIDYCDNPLVVLGVDIFNAKGCYITTRTLNPAVYVTKGSDGRISREIRIIGNTISSNIDNVESDAMVLNSIATGEISSNTITFWWRYGINFFNCTNLKIEKNKINSDPNTIAPTKYSVFESSVGNSSNIVVSNEVNQNISTLFARITSNKGFRTEARGESFAGSGVTTLSVNHGLNYTPSKNHVKLAPTNLEAASKNPFISTVDATTLTIGFVTATTEIAGVAWEIKKEF